MEIEDDFFIGKIVFGDLHRRWWVVVFRLWERGVNALCWYSATLIQSRNPAVQLENLAGSVSEFLGKMADKFSNCGRGVETTQSVVA